MTVRANPAHNHNLIRSFPLPCYFTADMFSLGATLYQMAYGALPHMPPSGKQMDFFKVKKNAPPFPIESYRNPHLRHLCARLMAVLPQDRLTLEEVRLRVPPSRRLLVVLVVVAVTPVPVLAARARLPARRPSSPSLPSLITPRLHARACCAGHEA